MISLKEAKKTAEVDRVRPERIAAVLNPDGTVAWRKE